MLIVHSKKLLGGSEHGVYEYTTPGTYELHFKRRTKATIWMVGGGGVSGFSNIYIWTSWTRLTMGGGSGAGFIGGIYIPAGTLTIKVGAIANSTTANSDTSITSSSISGALITAGGAVYYEGTAEGYNPSTKPIKNASQGGTIDVSLNAETIPGTIILNTDGETALDNTGCASVYNGWGRGADYVNGQGDNIGYTNGTNGYFKIIY